MAKDIVSEIDAALSGGIFGSRIAELDLILEAVFPGESMQDSDSILHGPECGFSSSRRCEEPRADFPAFKSWFAHPICTISDVLRSMRNEGRSSEKILSFLESELRVFRERIVIRQNVALPFHEQSMIAVYIAHLIDSIKNETVPLKWDVWLFLEENPDFDFEGN